MNSPSPQPNIRRKRWSARRKTLLILIALAVLWGGFEIVWRVTGEPAPVIDYNALVHEHVSSYQPEGENGWEELIELNAFFAVIKTSLSGYSIYAELTKEYILSNPIFPGFDDLRKSPFAPERFSWELHMLDQLKREHIFERMDYALDKPRLLRPTSSGGLLIHSVLSELVGLRLMVQSRIAALHIAARRGNWDEMALGFEYTLALIQTCSMQAYLIDRLVAYGLADLAFCELQNILTEMHPDESTCRALLEAMDCRLNWPPWELTLESERFCLLDLVQYVFSDDGHGDGRLDMPIFNTLTGITGTKLGAGGGVIGDLAALYLEGRKETTEKLNEYFDQLIAESHLSYSERAASEFDSDDFLDSLTNRSFLSCDLIAATDFVFKLQDEITLKERATRIMIHLEIYRHRHDEYPETLAELAGDLSPEQLIDPFNDGPITYRHLSDETNHLPYVLYSLGVDGIDQHADIEITDVTIDFPDSPFTEEGIDILLSRPRETRQEYDQ